MLVRIALVSCICREMMDLGVVWRCPPPLGTDHGDNNSFSSPALFWSTAALDDILAMTSACAPSIEQTLSGWWLSWWLAALPSAAAAWCHLERWRWPLGSISATSLTDTVMNSTILWLAMMILGGGCYISTNLSVPSAVERLITTQRCIMTTSRSGDTSLHAPRCHATRPLIDP